MRFRLLPLSALFVLIFAAAASADHQISVTALPAVPGLRCSAIDVNDAGDVLVSCTTNTLAGPPAVAYVWSNGVRTDIAGPADISGCVGINNAKQVACNTYSSTPFLWQNGTVTSLAPGMRSVSALNDLGEVSGGTNVGGANGLRRANGTIVTAPTSLFLFFGFAGSGGLNNLSQVPARPATTPLYDTVGTWSPAAGYVVADKGWDFLAGINDAGQMAAELHGQPMLFTPGRGWQVLPLPPGYPTGTATARSINSAGQATGYFIAEDHGEFSGQTHVVYWISRAFPIDLGAFQSLPTMASGSNSSGQVVGSATVSASESIPLLWMVTSVPSSLPQASPTDAAFQWIPTDGSQASGRMTINAPATGPFSVAANRVTSLQFTFAPGVSIQLVEGVEQTGRPVMSFDPLGEFNQQVIRRGRWVRENVTPFVPALPSGVLGVIDATPALTDDSFGVNAGIAYDPLRNVLYVARGEDNRFIYTITPSGSPVRQLDFQAAYLPNYIPYSLSYDPVSDHLYVIAIDASATTILGTRVVEMTTDGTQIIRAISLPTTNLTMGMVRADGIWLINGRALDHYSFGGDLIERIDLGASFPFPDSNPIAVATAPPFDVASDFLLVDERQNRLVRVSRQGAPLGDTTTRMLDADHFGGSRALAIDPARQRMFLLTRSGTIFVLSVLFTNTARVSPLLQLTGSSVASSSSPSPAGPVGSFTISARFDNPTGVTICNVFFKVTELTVDGRRGVDQLETVTVTSTGQQIQGFGEQGLGHVPFDLRRQSSEEFAFRVNLGSRKAFNFLVDAWGTQTSPGVSCR